MSLLAKIIHNCNQMGVFMKFKVEAEKGRWDIYKRRANGKRTVQQGDLMVRCALVNQDATAEEARDIPLFAEYAAQRMAA
jgi:hypothetical protein